MAEYLGTADELAWPGAATEPGIPVYRGEPDIPEGFVGFTMRGWYLCGEKACIESGWGPDGPYLKLRDLAVLGDGLLQDDDHLAFLAALFRAGCWGWVSLEAQQHG